MCVVCVCGVCVCVCVVCVCVCVCVCIGVCTHTSMHPGAAGCRLMVDGGHGRLHGEGDGAKWAKPVSKVRSNLRSEQHWLGACLVSEEGRGGGWHGGSIDSGRRYPGKCGQTLWHCRDLRRDPAFPLSRMRASEKSRRIPECRPWHK